MAGGVRDSAPTLEDSGATEHILVRGISCPTHRHLAGKNENVCLHKDLYNTCGFHCKSKNWEQIKCPSVDEWIHKAGEGHKTEVYSSLNKN